MRMKSSIGLWALMLAMLMFPLRGSADVYLIATTYHGKTRVDSPSYSFSLTVPQLREPAFAGEEWQNEVIGTCVGDGWFALVQTGGDVTNAATRAFGASCGKPTKIAAVRAAWQSCKTKGGATPHQRCTLTNAPDYYFMRMYSGKVEKSQLISPEHGAIGREKGQVFGYCGVVFRDSLFEPGLPACFAVLE